MGEGRILGRDRSLGGCNSLGGAGTCTGRGRSREGTEGKSLGGEQRQEPGRGRRQLDMGLGGA